MAIHPFANCTRADVYGFADGLRRLPVCNQFHDPLSTARRQPGILMYVHPVLRDCLGFDTFSFSRPGPDGQPMESSQLAHADVFVSSSSTIRSPVISRISRIGLVPLISQRGRPSTSAWPLRTVIQTVGKSFPF